MIGRQVRKLNPEKYAVMQWHMQSGNITTGLKVTVGFTLPALSATYLVTWKCHVDDSTKGRYDMILGHDLLVELGLSLKLSDHIIKLDDGPFKGFENTHGWFGYVWI